MEKLVYLLWQRSDVVGAELREVLLGETAKRLREHGASRITVSVDDEDVAQGEGVRIRRSEPPIRGMVSFWMDNSDDRSPCEAALAGASARLAGYLVAESAPIVNTRCIAPPGRRTPGVSMVTCIQRLPSLAYADWLRIWLEDHKQVAVETQSTFSYLRNAVVRALTPDAPPWDGIVEEGFPIEALTDPRVWYAAGDSQEKYRRNLERMLESCQRFLDFEPLESHPMSQYVLGTQD